MLPPSESKSSRTSFPDIVPRQIEPQTRGFARYGLHVRNTSRFGAKDHATPTM